MTQQSFREILASTFASRVEVILNDLDDAMDTAIELDDFGDRPDMLFDERARAKALVTLSNDFTGKDLYITVTVEDIIAINKLKNLIDQLDNFILWARDRHRTETS